MGTFAEVLAAVDRGDTDLGFVAIENSIEGTVTVNMDALALEYDLLIQRAVVLGIQLHLLAPAGVALSDVRRVLTYPVAAAQCRSWMEQELPGVEVVAANSYAEAARLVAEAGRSAAAAVSPAPPAPTYGP